VDTQTRKQTQKHKTILDQQCSCFACAQLVKSEIVAIEDDRRHLASAKTESRQNSGNFCVGVKRPLLFACEILSLHSPSEHKNVTRVTRPSSSECDTRSDSR